MSSATTATTGDVQVLEFTLGEQTYCVEIEYVTEILDGGEMTEIPNTPDYVEGVMDLRGQTTTIVNPMAVLEAGGVDPDDLVTDGGMTQNRIIMLEPDIVDGDGTIGWLVSDVNEVTSVSETALEAEGVTDAPMFRGLIKKNDEFTIWLNPHELLA